ncbi:hypothetical protein [Alkalilacustris brevis]|uniref:hypothetical protein n=1 Tax=Alkalilacustris brevis TaxID=2026338 RepID=UPI0012D343D1|nr:hypothetical protein [Alkalilacustris brevis]
MQATVVPKRPQRPKSVSRNAVTDAPETRIHEWAQASGRMLVATFFIASAVSNMGNSHFDFSAIAHAESSIVLNAMIYSMAFAVLVGRYLHVTALVLALAMLWSSTLQVTSGEQELASYWQDLAVIGALFYMAASKSETVAQRLPRAWMRSKSVTPRRVLPEGRVMVDSVAGPGPQVSRNHVARPVAMPVFTSRRPSR